MNIIELIYAPYSIKLKKPFLTAKGSVTKREGFVINLRTSDGLIGVGDAAPFPALGSENYKEAEKALSSLKLDLKIDLDNLGKSISENLLDFGNLPALRHGIEQALLDLFSKEKNLSIGELIGRETKNEIDINALIDFQSPEETLKNAMNLKADGFTTIKMKAGRDNFKIDYECIECVRNSLGDGIKIRVDVNGKWKLDEAKKNIESLQKLNIEYIEQPVSSIKELIELKKVSGIPIAADESLRTHEDAFNLISNKAADVFILKPMMLGGLIPTLNLIDAADINGVKAVISSSFESGIGRPVAIFAASTVKTETAHGIHTASYFEKDIIPDKYPVIRGRITLYKEQ